MHLRRLLIISALTLFADQATKAAVMRSLSLGESIPVIPGVLDLTYVRNPGAAFGFFATASESFRIPFFIGVSVVAIGVVLYFYLRTARGNGLLQAGLSLVLGGAAGNLVDRIRFQEVVDFIDLYYGRFHWPAFNVADSAISVGVFFLILDMVLAGRHPAPEEV